MPDINKKILDCLIEQADRYDKKNMQFEQDLLFMINKGTAKLLYELPSKSSSINTVLQMEQFIMQIQKVYDAYINTFIKLLSHKFTDYADMAYKYTGDLIELGREVSGNLSQHVSEQKSIDYGDDTVKFIQKHAFELLNGHSQSKINNVRAELVQMVLKGTASKSNVRAMINKVLNTGMSKAEEIAQTELSRAYNIGTMRRLTEYQKLTGEKVRKYWHGFKYSDRTCAYCAERIGGVYDIDDDSETLPAHVRCRCVWLPILEAWEDNANVKMISRANMLNTAYSKDMIYNRIRTRLGVDYIDLLSDEEAIDYLNGDRSTKMINALQSARREYIDSLIQSFNIQPDTSNSRMSNEFNIQMKFWKGYVAQSMTDGNYNEVSNAKEAIKGVMLLSWNAEQLSKWSDLLSKIQ